MGTNVVKLKAFGKSAINRVWKKVVIALMTGVLAVGLLAYSKRHTIIIGYLQENNEKQEMVIIEMLENAKPRIERELNMTLPEKIYSLVAGDTAESTGNFVEFALIVLCAMFFPFGVLPEPVRLVSRLIPIS